MFICLFIVSNSIENYWPIWPPLSDSPGWNAAQTQSEIYTYIDESTTGVYILLGLQSHTMPISIVRILADVMSLISEIKRIHLQCGEKAGN